MDTNYPHNESDPARGPGHFELALWALVVISVVSYCVYVLSGRPVTPVAAQTGNGDPARTTFQSLP